MAFTWGAVAAVAALVAACALVVLFVPPVTALVGLAASVLYVTGGISAALALLAGLGAAYLFCSTRTRAFTTPSASPSVYDKADKFFYHVEVNGNKHLVLNPEQYEFYTSSQLQRAEPLRATKEQSDLLNVMSSLKGSGMTVISFDITDKIHEELKLINIVNYLEPLVKNNRQYLFVCNSRLGIILSMLIMECLLKKDLLTREFVRNTLQTLESQFGLIEEHLRNKILSAQFLLNFDL